ncbi:hypothetical protein [Mycoplasma sp. Z1473D]
MSVGRVELSIGLDVKSIDKTLKRMQKKFTRSINNLKNMFMAAKLGSYLFIGADKSIQEYMAKMRQIAALNEAGFGKDISNRLFEITNNFEKLGYSADMANDSFTQFITTGKATSLQTIGIYLDKNTKQTLTNASAQERLNYLLKNGNRLYNQQANAMPPAIANMIKMKKAGEDVQKALGQAFLATINAVINALGGITPALKTAIWAFTAYKTAMILGNIGIGISKAIAIGSVWSAPAALFMGASALASISALIGGAAIATAALNNMEIDKAPTQGNQEGGNLNIKIVQDRYGSINEVSRANGNNRKVQTNYGSGN